MDTAITFTPAQVLALCSAIVVISSAVHVVINAIIKLTAPNKLQNERLDKIERTLDRHEELFKHDLLRLNDIDDGNRVTQKAILALLSHGIDGNNVSELKKAKSELQDYLLRKH